MPTCPKCGKKIDHLVEFTTGCMKGTLGIYKGFPDYKRGEFYPDLVDWQCPKCNLTLFADQKNAIEFLKGRD